MPEAGDGTEKRRITDIVIHCTASEEGRDVSADDIRALHLENGWDDIGYHYVVRLDGTVESGRPEHVVGAHVYGHNGHSIGVVYVGGIDADKCPKDTRTTAQRKALRRVVAELLEKYPDARVCGHRDFPNVAKACPSFDVETDL
ncbi:N-acetylmuramoyl-L-alanine amidase [Parasphingopyxis marina]|uniref:N-acetylmuramoyl-L-alanine amidase n=1 Tax=Parasphingopyxis marina TaxID=2761622 RepID=A0A842I0I8_9SPHN|nr:N-acetylmuramoyl-L-alanine amidase [Parasphingopyxis marina]MBC2778645.1 N-acetylmuramoyl-L-alanine amidase [Parasphingopyxis marina]